MRYRLGVAAVLAAAAVSSCGGVLPTNGPDVDVSDRDVDAAVAGATDLAFDLLRELGRDDDGNVLLGPASIAEGLAMPYLGARGETAQEMAAVLGDAAPGTDVHHAALQALRTTLASSDSGDSGVTLRTANRLFGQRGYGFADPFLAAVSRWYTAPLAEVDFANDAEGARHEINSWTAEQTVDRINELFPAGTIDPTTVLALVSATYLDAPWHFPFNRELTSPERFGRLDGTTASVPTMHFNEYLPSGLGEGWQAVRLPYRGRQLSMIVIVPDDLRAFEAQLDSEVLDSVRNTITDGGIHLSLPRFSLSYHASLIPSLRTLGVESAFGDEADFSGITGAPGLSISAIEHETFVEIDEEGTEAAAATGTAMAGSHGPTVAVDRPFLFVVQHDKTGAVLFAGRIADPTVPA